MTDHVFKEGEGGGLEFVGDFEGLYQAEADPWGQSGFREDMASYYDASRGRVCAALRRRRGEGLYGGLEIGCGHGWTLPRFQGAFGGFWSGLDISPTAIAKAKELHPSYTFIRGDICNVDLFTPHSTGKYGAVILSQILWYVLDRLDCAVLNAIKVTQPGGLVIVSQAFLKDQKYGREVIDGFHGAMNLFMARYQSLSLIEAFYDDSTRHAHHDGLLIFRKANARAE